MKRLVAFSLAIFFSYSGVVMACPDETVWGNEVHGAQFNLGREHAFSVIAGGGYRLENCSYIRHLSPVGWTTSRPDFTFRDYRSTAGESLIFETYGTCDTVLLINTGNGNWFYDDDDGAGNGARIVLTRPSSGLYDVWVGTYSPSSCDAGLLVRSSITGRQVTSF